MPSDAGTPRYDLRGRVVLISGPARGIGSETARRLARRGARLALAGLEPDRLTALAEELGGAERAAWFEADVREAEALDRAAAGAVRQFGRIDVVIANAGIAPVGTVAGIDRDDFEAAIQVNLLGAWRTIRSALPHVIEQRGYVLQIASLAALVHLPLMAHYAAAKAGVSAMADSLRMELRESGVDVGVAYFGFIDTDMTRTAHRDAEEAGLRGEVRRRWLPRPLPVGAAASAIVDGIERRARWIVVPPGAKPVLFFPALFQRIAEREARRAALRLRPGDPSPRSPHPRETDPAGPATSA